jgi:hypothetical protein
VAENNAVIAVPSTRPTRRPPTTPGVFNLEIIMAEIPRELAPAAIGVMDFIHAI